MDERADIVVAGAGHNSLIAACYLAKAGYRCLVLDAGHVPGGGAATEEILLPGYGIDTCATGHTLIRVNPLLTEDELGLIAGSMGTPSFVARGLGAEEALLSSSHGAGRLLSRTEAGRRIRGADLQRQLRRVHYDHRYLVALRDEAPAAYRDIRLVMNAQRDLTRQHVRLTPVLNFKYAERR